MSTTTYLDEFMDKMYLVPNDINRYLRLIRTLDKKAEVVQQSLNQLQGKFLNQVKQFKQTSNGTMNGSTSKKQSNGVSSSQIPSSLKSQYQKIVAKQKQVYGYYKQKYQVSQQLKVMVADYYEQLDTELKNKLKEKTEQQQQMFFNRRKVGAKYLQANLTGLTGPINNSVSNLGGKLGGSNAVGSTGYSANNNSMFGGQYMYDLKQPTYCICGRASFGEMVMCENPYCQRQWFHLDCIEEKNLPEKWYCSQCQKQKEKTRNPHSRGFFVNKES